MSRLEWRNSNRCSVQIGEHLEKLGSGLLKLCSCYGEDMVTMLLNYLTCYLNKDKIQRSSDKLISWLNFLYIFVLINKFSSRAPLM